MSSSHVNCECVAHTGKRGSCPECGVTDIKLADEMIVRLNKLCEEEPARAAIEALCLHARHTLPDDALAPHPTIQVLLTDDEYSVGFLGLLNGLVGIIPEGELRGGGYIAAIFDTDDGGKATKLRRFVRLDHEHSKIGMPG